MKCYWNDDDGERRYYDSLFVEKKLYDQPSVLINKQGEVKTVEYRIKFYGFWFSRLRLFGITIENKTAKTVLPFQFL